MNTVTHDIPFSFNQPEAMLRTVSMLLQERLKQPAKPPFREMIVRNTLALTIIDSNTERSQQIAKLLEMVGYRTVAVTSALEAFTLFLQGDFIPCAILLEPENGGKQLFLLRLIQQMLQKYEWEPLLLRLQPTISTISTAQQQQPDLVHMPQSPSQLSPDLHHSGLPVSLSPTRPLPRIARRTDDAQPRPTHMLGPGAPLQSTHFAAPTSSSVLAVVEENTNAPIREIVAVHSEKKRISLTGQNLGRYEIREHLGSDVHSEVYKTYDRLREQESALKTLQTDIVPFYLIERSTEEVTIFQQEAELLRNIKHPHILPILNCGKSYISGTPFVYKTMPYCAGHSLGHWLYQKGQVGKFAAHAAVHLIIQLADALQCVHEQQITYQNFKLSNILIINKAKNIQEMQVALSDFSTIQDGSFFAGSTDSFLYMAPERWEGIVLPASDQYGLAAIAYELLTGRPPFQGTAERTLRLLHTNRQAKTPAEFNPALPSRVNGVILRALAKRPQERFSSVSAFATALMHCWS